MTTIAQVKELIAPLLQRHSDLALVGRQIYVKPLHHFARFVLIDRMTDPDLFDPKWAVAHLFEVRSTFPLSWGNFLANERSARRGIWSIREPDLSVAMVEAIETQALPVLRRMVSLDHYLAFVSAHYFRHQLFEWPEAKIVVDVARGDLSAARALRDAHFNRWRDDPSRDEESRAELRRVRQLCARLDADDRPGLAALLHEWEATTVKNLKIEQLWEQTPFPLELQT